MGVEIGESCRSWAEDIYWNHFQFVHFALFLRSGYEQQLALPKRFSDNLKKKLPEKVALRGPGGLVWNVVLTIKDDTSYLTHGWQQFVKDHSLKENDLLIFKYNGESQFDVLIFEGESLCENAASYFIRKCGHAEHKSGYLTPCKRKDSDHSLEEVGNRSNADVQCASLEKSVHGNSIKVPVAAPSQTPSQKTFNAAAECASPVKFVVDDGVTVRAGIPSQTTGKRIRVQDCDFQCVKTKGRGRPPKESNDSNGQGGSPPKVSNDSNGRRGRPPKASNDSNGRRGRPPKVSIGHKEMNWEAVSEPASASRSGTYPTLYTSNRRPVTEDEINNALKLAQAACTDDSISVVMQPANVYNRFYVTVPGKWATEHLSPRSQDLILRLGSSEWLAKYSFDRIQKTGGLSGGWKDFAVDNNLEEFDVCVFKPAGQMNDNILILDVNIFRVIEEVAPLSKVNSAGKRASEKVINAIQIQT